MESFIEQVCEEYKVDKPTLVEGQDSITIDCGQITERLDHYTCGDSDCECYESEGWCEDAWEEECERPLQEEFQQWKEKHMPEDAEFSADSSVCSKGFFHVTVKASKSNKRAKVEA